MVGETVRSVGGKVEVDSRRRALDAFLEHNADDAADAAFLAGVAMIERACQRARESVDYRWRSFPRGELRALRRSLKLGLLMCRFAVLTREADDERWDELAAVAQLAEDLRARTRRAAAGKQGRGAP